MIGDREEIGEDVVAEEDEDADDAIHHEAEARGGESPRAHPLDGSDQQSR